MIAENNGIAQNKLKNNVSEFIIYMYQMEDLCRVYQFNIEDIRQYVIRHFPVDDAEKSRMEEWFRNIMTRMEEQDVRESGHLKEVQEYVGQLLDLKNRLLSSDTEFAEIYNNARPYIRQSLEEAKQAGYHVSSDIQACLNGVYGLLLCRMNGREVPEELNEGLDAFGLVLSYLSYKYKQENFLSSN